MHYLRIPIILLLLFVSFTACKKTKPSNWTLQTTKLKFSYIQTARITLDNANKSFAIFHQKVSLFNSTMSNGKFDECRATWQTAYSDYLLLGGFENNHPNLNAGFVENKSYLDYSPINYSYIDYTSTSPSTGIISDLVTYPNFAGPDLLSLHQIGSEQNVTIGFHVLEFLMWGEDLSLSSTNIRPASEFSTTNETTNRRRGFFNSSSYYTKNKLSLLSFGESYENELSKLDPKETMEFILGGLTNFITNDIIDHTIQTPLNSQNHNDELCDFSDLTLGLLTYKIQSIRNIWDGRNIITSSNNSDYYLKDMIEEIAPSHNGVIESSLDKIDSLLASITVNFENAIINNNERAKLIQLIDELNKIVSELNTFKGNFN